MESPGIRIRSGSCAPRGPGLAFACLWALTLTFGAGCTADPPADPPADAPPGAPADAHGEQIVEFTVPPGASFGVVTDTLEARGLVRWPTLFRGYARLSGADRNVRSGRYSVPADIGWIALVDQLVEGRVVTTHLLVPEGFTLRQMAPRLAATAELDPEEVEARLLEAEGEEWAVPGPGLEGYLFPDTYRLAPGSSLDAILGVMVERYKVLWTPERRARAEELEMTEREVMTLASIVQAEARLEQEMPIISAVFHNRLRLGYPLQADPTVQYALAERRSRLLYSDIDEVADHPYNTYTNPGLPPGPIGAAGEKAFEATLEPADVDYLYFVARPDGSHIFTRSLAEHNRARVEARIEWNEREREREEERKRQEQEETERGTADPIHRR